MLTALFAFILGLLIGSFLNVCIYRMPRDLSVIRPRSFCPACEHPIAWYDNLPLLSYALLQGRCRHCQKPISGRYPVVELLTGAVFFSFVMVLGPTAPAIKFCLLGALLIGLVFSDLEARILPDEFTLGGALLGIAIAWFVPTNDVIAHALLSIAGAHWSDRRLSVAESVLGAIVPAGFLWLGGALFKKIRRKEGLGFGDVKMMAMVGAFLGLRGALLTLIAGSVAGSIIGLMFILIRRKDLRTYELPFGAFLGAAALAVSLFGQKVIAWYASLI